MKHPHHIVTAVQRLGDVAAYEHPGYFEIDLKNGERIFGTADSTWDSDVMNVLHHAVRRLPSTVKADRTDADASFAVLLGHIGRAQVRKVY